MPFDPNYLAPSGSNICRDIQTQEDKSWTGKGLSHICSDITRNLKKGPRGVLELKQTVQSYSQLAQGKTIPTGPFVMG